MTAPTLVKPLLVATVGGHPLRFFLPPDGRPDFPWHAVDDLHRCLGCGRELSQNFLRYWQSSNQRFLRTPQSAELMGSQIRSIPTADGIVTVASSFVARETIGAMMNKGRAPESVLDEYEAASRAASDAHLPPGSDEWWEWQKLTGRRYDPSDELFERLCRLYDVGGSE
jgi:hypothetical protein